MHTTAIVFDKRLKGKLFALRCFDTVVAGHAASAPDLIGLVLHVKIFNLVFFVIAKEIKKLPS